MKDFYELTIAGLVRRLPLCKVEDKMSIAAFVMFNDVELTKVCATEILSKAPEFDILFTAEAKGIPLVYEMARQSGKPYLVARKGSKLYMSDPKVVEVRSITTNRDQQLVMDIDEINLMTGKKVLIADDVISTGGSLLAMEKIVELAKGNIVCRAAVLAEGVAAQRDDLLFLNELPLFES